jgi:hypothetical protein
MTGRGVPATSRAPQRVAILSTVRPRRRTDGPQRPRRNRRDVLGRSGRATSGAAPDAEGASARLSEGLPLNPDLPSSTGGLPDESFPRKAGLNPAPYRDGRMPGVRAHGLDVDGARDPRGDAGMAALVQCDWLDPCRGDDQTSEVEAVTGRLIERVHDQIREATEMTDMRATERLLDVIAERSDDPKIDEAVSEPRRRSRCMRGLSTRVKAAVPQSRDCRRRFLASAVRQACRSMAAPFGRRRSATRDEASCRSSPMRSRPGSPRR